MEKNTKRKLAAGAVAALAVAGGGAAIGATQFNSPKEQSQAVINDAASQLGIDPTKLTDALKKGLENRVDAAVAAGQLTKAQGDALKAKIESGANVPLILPGVGQGLGRALGGGFGGGPGLRFGFGVGGAFTGRDDVFATAATYLGVTEAELKTELASGKTLAQIATAQGKTADGLVQALYDAQKKQLDQAVTAGKLTQSQEDAILANLKTMLTSVVNGTFPSKLGLGLGQALRGFGSGFHEFHNFRGLPGLPGAGAPSSPSPSQGSPGSSAGTGTI